jgi:hypothetical protein
MPKKIITPEEFIELSKVMDEREIIQQYNIVNQNQTNIFQKLKKYSANSIGFVIGNLGLLKKTIVPVLTLAVIGGGYYGYHKYTEQIGWYKWQVSELEGKLGQERGNVKDNESKISKLQTDLEEKTDKIKSIEKSVSDLENKVSDKEFVISQKEIENKTILTNNNTKLPLKGLSSLDIANGGAVNNTFVQSNVNEVNQLKEENNQLLEEAKKAIETTAIIGNIKACIAINLGTTSSYNCNIGYQSYYCNNFYQASCSYAGNSYSCEIGFNKNYVSNCKKDY